MVWLANHHHPTCTAQNSVRVGQTEASPPCERVRDFEIKSQLDPRGPRKRTMPVIKVKDNESFEGAMKRFKKTCEKAGILTELRRREFYDKPSIRKKKKEAAARKRALKKIRRMGN